GFVILLVLAAGAVALGWRRQRLASVLVAGAAIALAFLARRNVGLIGFGVLPLVADGFAPLARRLEARPRAAALVGAALGAAPGVASARVVSNRYYLGANLSRSFGLGVSQQLFASAGVDFLGAHGPDAPFFNADTLGGFVLWRTYPHRRVRARSRR